MITTKEFDIDTEEKLELAKLYEALYYNPDTGNFSSKLHAGVRMRCIIANNGYIYVCYGGKKYAAHRLAWFYYHGRWPKEEVDHVNGNPSDNRIKNLREATREQNTHNQRLRKNNTSGIRCVSKNRANGKWKVQIWRFGQRFQLGEYADKSEAARVANEFLRKTDEEFFCDVRAKHELPDDQIALLATIKRSKDLGFKPRLLPENRVWVSHMLNAWGRWAYSGMSEKSQVSPIARFMESVSGRGAITSDGIVAIMESLHNRGYHGEDLIKKMAQIIANLKHSSAPACTDEEGMFMDRIILECLGNKTVLTRVAINYYVYGHATETIAQYIQRITRGSLTMPQARDRVRWCISLIEARVYHAAMKEIDEAEFARFAA
ncbi:antiterminator Q family protein [Atlantibacter hermannii]|uniref:antiterminator Q family protein n=1 Tax=Atlantibacter hermannii TaxID=565 RepID=UPI0028ACA815|nr:antiterminator Q family protein [Atlantibacter hermannii]